MELKVEGRRPVHRPKKTWSKVENSGGNSYQVQPPIRSGKLGMVNEDDDDNDNDIR